MSLAYAEALTYREDLGGQVGAPELFDNPGAVREKANLIANLIASAAAATGQPRRPCVVAFTGADLSTAAGIPDFRGPDGVWTRQRDGRPPPRMLVGESGSAAAAAATFSTARPTFSHAALVALTHAGLVSLVVSQNVDGLHLRAGQPAGSLAELHGNVFAEACGRAACGRVYVRAFETGSVGRRTTPRRCTACGGRLRDNVLDWEQALPETELRAAEAASSQAAVALALGTSLQIVPACDLPLRTVAAGGSLAIVNLQATPKDRAAALVVRGRCDEVMRAVMHGLAVRGLVPHACPPWVRTDTVAVCGSLALAGSGAKRVRGAHASGARKGVACIWLASPDGEGGAFPVVAMVAGLAVWVVEDGEDDGGGGGEEEPDACLSAAPWRVRVPVMVVGGLKVRVRLGLSPAADPGAPAPVVSFTLSPSGPDFREVVQWESQRVEWGAHHQSSKSGEEG